MEAHHPALESAVVSIDVLDMKGRFLDAQSWSGVHHSRGMKLPTRLVVAGELGATILRRVIPGLKNEAFRANAVNRALCKEVEVSIVDGSNTFGAGAGAGETDSQPSASTALEHPIKQQKNSENPAAEA